MAGYLGGTVYSFRDLCTIEFPFVSKPVITYYYQISRFLYGTTPFCHHYTKQEYGVEPVTWKCFEVH
jgi:hypothetical protein